MQSSFTINPMGKLRLLIPVMLLAFSTTVQAQLDLLIDVNSITVVSLEHNRDCGNDQIDILGLNLDPDPRWMFRFYYDGVQVSTADFCRDGETCGTETVNFPVSAVARTASCLQAFRIDMQSWEEDDFTGSGCPDNNIGSNNECPTPFTTEWNADPRTSLSPGGTSMPKLLQQCGYNANIDIDWEYNNDVFVSVNGPTLVCEGSAVLLSAAHVGSAPQPSSGIFNWYADTNRSVLLHTGTTYTPIVSGPTKFYVTEVYGSCESVPTSFEIATQPYGLTFSSKTDVSCPGGSDGTITVNVLGGITNNHYYRVDGVPAPPNWAAVPGTSGGSAVLTYTGLSAGDYDLLLETDLFCYDTLTSVTTLLEPSDGQIDSVVVTPVSCNGAGDGSMAIYYSGLTGTVQFSINGGGTYPYSTSSSPMIINGLNPIGYNLIARAYPGNCLFPYTNNPVNVTQPNVLSFTNNGIGNDALCNGTPTGSISSIVPTGGTPPYEFSIDTGNTYQAANVFDSLAIGTYRIRVRDVNGCIADGAPISISEPAPLFLDVDSFANSCPGAFTGQVLMVFFGGGTGPYEFYYNGLLSTMTTNTSFTGLGAGSYKVTIRDANGCEFTDTTTVFNLDTLETFVDSIADASCFGFIDGFISIRPEGGFPPYQYSYNGAPGTLDSFSNTLGAGQVFVTITDNVGCESVIDTSISQPFQIIPVLDSVVNVACAGDSTGGLMISVFGGNGGYTYLWSNGDTTEDLMNVVAGNYSVVVTDSVGCANGGVFTVTETPALEVTVADSFNVSCNGGADGAIDITVNGGTTPYTFIWSDGETQEDNSGLTLGTYTITVTDFYGCSATRSVTLSEPDTIAINLVSVTKASCNGVSDGGIDISVNGGAGPYTYLWSNFAISEDLVNVAFGTYSVVVTDANGCTKSATFIVNENSTLSVLGTVSDVSCFGLTDGVVDLTVTGGGFPYSFKWSNGGIADSLSGLAKGLYFVTVTDAFGCNFIKNFNVDQPDPIALTDSVDLASCGLADGNIILTVSGGSAPYNYLWNDTANQTTRDLLNARSGIYTVTVTDFNACVDSGTFILNDSTDLTFTDSIADALCFGSADGAIFITTSLGAGGYGWNWSNGAITEDNTGLLAGDYDLTVSDAALCNVFGMFTIDEPDSLIAISATTDNNACFAASGPNGEVDITVSGGTMPYSYLWSNGDVTEDIDSLVGGLFTVTVTDANGCQLILTDSVGSIDTISVVSNVSQLTCNTDTVGSINLTVSGGVPNYSYSWSNGANTEDLINLGVGIYTITITDQAGCQAVRSYTISAPSPINLSWTTVGATCNGGVDGEIDLMVSGGVAPYTYFWSTTDTTEDVDSLTSGFYAVTVTDSVGCTEEQTIIVNDNSTLTIADSSTDISCFGLDDGVADIEVSGGTPNYIYQWNTGDLTQDISGLDNGSYSVTVTDAAGCRTLALVNINEPAPLILSGITVPASCNGGNDGAADLNIVGGTMPYNILWSTGATTDTINNVNAGTYVVTVTDANLCQSITSFNVSENTTVTINPIVTDVSCFGLTNGSIFLTITGGAFPYNYQWSDGLSFKDRTGLGGGDYTITVTDNNLCQKVQTIEVDQPDTLTAIALVDDNNSCAGTPTGSILVQQNGGTPPFNYNWSNAATTQSLFNIGAGNYDLTITDANGCAATISETVGEVDSLSFNVNAQDISCFGLTDGSIDISVLGGSPPYTYNWSNGATTEDLFSLSSGTYDLTIEDKFGCMDSIAGISISEPSQLQASTSGTDASCFGANDGSIALTVNGGVTPYQFLWSNGDSVQNPSNLVAGNYSVLINDGNGCLKNAAFTIGEPAPIVFSLSKTDINCLGDSSGAITASASGGHGSFTYSWSNGGNTATIDSLAAGWYTVTATDSVGCTGVDSIEILQPSTGVTVVIADTQDISCLGANDGFIDIFVTGGTFPYNYLWSDGSITDDRVNLPAGFYGITVTDVQGCTGQLDSIEIVEPAQISATAVLVDDVSCNGGTDGRATVSITGGTAPFAYLWNNFQLTDTASGLPAGSATVIVTDANGCQSGSGIAISEPAALSFIDTFLNIDCFGDSTGAAAILSLSGGVQPYSFAWNTGASDSIIFNQAAGLYTVSITDANNCTETRTFNITQPSELLANISASSPNCAGGNTGVVSVFPNGGTAPYTFNWNTSPPQTSIQAINLAAGWYAVTVTDTKGCEVIDSAEVTQPDSIALTISTGDITCFSGNDGEFSVSVNGGVAPYNYILNGNIQLDSVFTGLTAGTYLVEVEDANTCKGVAQVSLFQPDPVAVSLIIDQALPGPNSVLQGQSISLTVEVDDPAAVSSIQWAQNSDIICDGSLAICSDQFIEMLETSFFRVTAFDQNSCEAGSDSLTIFVQEENSTFVPSGFSPNGDGVNEFFNVVVLDYSQLKLSVFDRWGKKIWERQGIDSFNGNNESQGWDGRNMKGEPMPMGTYVYQLDIEYRDGGREKKHGTITLIR